MDFQHILQLEYFGNSVENYLLGLVLILVGLVFNSALAGLLVRVVSKSFVRSKYKLTYQDYRGHLKKPLRQLVFLVFLYLAVNHLEFPEAWNLAPVENFGLKRVISRIYLVFWAIVLIRVAVKFVVIGGEMLLKKAHETESKSDDQLIPFVVEAVKVIVIIFGVLIASSTIFKINVGSLVAGLGIGGLALALAAKESLENLFGSFTIFLDKPFIVGDMVTISGISGTVEKVGFRSTRIRTLEKSYLTIPNKMMVDAELDNLSLRTFRRVKFNIGILYGTKMSTIKSIVQKIQQFIDEHPHTNQDGQVKFMDFGSSSLDIMILYFIDTMDYSSFLNIKEEINYKIMEIVEAEDSDFAFPTQTIHLNKENS